MTGPLVLGNKINKRRRPRSKALPTSAITLFLTEATGAVILSERVARERRICWRVCWGLTPRLRGPIKGGHETGHPRLDRAGALRHRLRGDWPGGGAPRRSGPPGVL